MKVCKDCEEPLYDALDLMAGQCPDCALEDMLGRPAHGDPACLDCGDDDGECFCGKRKRKAAA